MLNLANKFKLQYISDIHLEHKIKMPIIIPKTNYLALLGDIGYPNRAIYKDFLKYCSRNWDKVLLISGNHEYDGIKCSNGMIEVNNSINELVNEYNNVYYLNNNKYLLDNHVILGTTLWTNYQFCEVRKTLHKNSIRWLEDNIKDNINNNIIILSHHLPSYKLIIPKYYSDKYLPMQNRYANNLDYLIKQPINAWLCGHSHCQFETYINNIYCGINTYVQ